MKSAKVFKNGRSQAVRIPAEFRFDVDEVYVRRGDREGELVLSSRMSPKKSARSWADVFAELRELDPPHDWVRNQPQRADWEKAFASLRTAKVGPLLRPDDRDRSPAPDRVNF